MIPSFAAIPALFSLFSILVLLLGDSFLRWYFIGALALVFLLSFKKLNFSWAKSLSRQLSLGGVFLLTILVSFLFTHSTPLSLDSLSFYLFAFLSFVFALSINFKEFKKEYLAYFIVFIGFVFSFLSLFFLFDHRLAAQLPGMNLIYATYGHNHLAAFLLLILPLAWREIAQALQNKKRKLYWLELAGVLFMSFTLLLSFGRTALFIGLLQLGFIWIFYFRKQHRAGYSLLSKFILPGVILLLSLIFGLKMYFSYAVSAHENFVCPLPAWLSNKVCKPLDAEMRPLYFSQAFQAMRHYPLFGYGPGTFELIDKKYQQLPFSGTFYAHNHFLQVGAEMGILAAIIFSLLIFSLFKEAGKLAFPAKIKIKNFSFDQALYLGSFALLINAFFDFDWSYLGIFSLTLFFLGLILRNKHSTDKKQIDDSLVALISQIIAAILLLLTAIYLLLEILIRTGKTSLAFNIFPYFEEHAKVFEAEISSFSPAQVAKLTRIYQFDANAYFFNQRGIASLTDEQLAARKNLYLIDPWLNLNSEDIAWYLKKGDYQAADQNLTRLLELMEIAEQKFGYQLGYTKKFALASQRLDVADYYFTHGDPRKTAEYYLWARSVEPWIFAHRLPPVTSQTPVANLREFLLAIADQDVAEWGENYYYFINWHLRVFRQVLADGDEAQIKFWFELTDQKFTNLTFLLWQIGSTHFMDSLANQQQSNSLADTQQQLLLWSSLWETYRQHTDKIGFDEYEKALSKALIELSRTMVANSDLTVVQKGHFQQSMANTTNLVDQLQLATESYLTLKQNQLADVAMKMFAHAQTGR